MKSRFPSLGILVIACTVFMGVFVGGAGAATPKSTNRTDTGPGYWLMTGWSTSYAFNAPYLGDQASIGSDACVNNGQTPVPPYACVGLSSVASGMGYWIAVGPTDALVPRPAGYVGEVVNEGETPSGPASCGVTYGLNAPIIGVAAAAQGAWLVGADGGVLGLCGAPFLGSMGGKPLNAPIVGMAATPDGGGYWLVAKDGGVFAFGDALFAGSMGGRPLSAPMVGIAADPDGAGYWSVASDGGVFAFGGAPFLGSAVGQALDAPIVGITSRG